jgi:hypothetical protein
MDGEWEVRIPTPSNPTNIPSQAEGRPPEKSFLNTVHSPLPLLSIVTKDPPRTKGVKVIAKTWRLFLEILNKHTDIVH